MDYRKLAEKVVEINDELQYQGYDDCDRIAAIAAALESALTPRWTDVPQELPEGAVYGTYIVVDVWGIRSFIYSVHDIERISEADLEGSKFMGPFAPMTANHDPIAFNAAGEVVR